MKRDYPVLICLAIAILGYAGMWTFSYWPVINAWIAFGVYCVGGIGLVWLAVRAVREAKADQQLLADINRELDRKQNGQ